MEFKDLNIIEPILKALKIKEYTIPTPVQEKSIPVLLNNQDVMGSAQTGTGKTAAFAIPILQKIYLEKLEENTKEKTIKALVLAPTRELALQIYDNFVEYSKYINVNATVVYGGIKQSRQVRDLQRGVDILVATPGRLLDLIKQKKLSLSNVDYLVLDEADRMLDMGFINDVKKIISMVKKERQTMLFSATLPKAITNLANEILQNPVRIKVSPEDETIDRITQSVYYVSKKSKIKLLIKLLKQEEYKAVLVFSRTKYGAEDIVRDLNAEGLKSSSLHGDKAQGDRQKVLKAFKKKEIRILVATDIAARGIDVNEVSHVINYDLPEVPETYIHRIGRTGRAGQGGVTIAFCSPNQFNLLQEIEKHIKMKIPMSKDKKLSLDPSKIVVAPHKRNTSKSSKTSGNKNKKHSSSRRISDNRKVETKSNSRNRNQQRNRRNK
ncbi:ATP-dependent RNA helicase RhlE [Candidatus Izimaplasma bacterium HR1]|jgi:ATP-dependent RNA helicase RhlE|uniref:DEAD/DEAH box helicase n=1 Tax=Candidatus Izimoplasma sp. HR1 TaxID=1541959 RepID=UPI0004F8EEA6|nr:ATP-dependent RNA helicase RhlE [Candidatus Izimaplasma bacterium HR1]